MSLEEHCLFFDGASKGNPWASDGGGVILDPGGETILSFAWGLGHDSNNRVEALALWKGLKLSLSLNITALVVFGDSWIIIQAANSNRRPAQGHLSTILKKVKLMQTEFQKISFFHILRSLNTKADLEANKGSLLSRSTLSLDGSEILCYTP